MGNIGMDISVEELRGQHQKAMELIAEQRADLDQATQEVERLRALLEGQGDRNGDLEIEIERLKGVLEAARGNWGSADEALMHIQSENTQLREALESLHAQAEGLLNDEYPLLHVAIIHAVTSRALAQPLSKLSKAQREKEWDDAKSENTRLRTVKKGSWRSRRRERSSRRGRHRSRQEARAFRDRVSAPWPASLVR